MAVIRRQRPPMAGPDILILERNTGMDTEIDTETDVGTVAEVDTETDVGTVAEVDTEMDAETAGRLMACW